MSKFNTYARQADTAAKEAFKVLQEAQAAMKKAEDAQRDYPERSGFVSAEYAAKATRAKADVLEAKEQLKAAQRNMLDVETRIQGIKKDLAADLERSFYADPEKIDSATMDLLKSGILKPAEYVHLYEQANTDDNPTMMRIIGKYAQDVVDAPDAQNKMDYKTRATLTYIGSASRKVDGSDYLEAYALLEDVFHRCTYNPRMIDHWDELVGETVEEF